MTISERVFARLNELNMTQKTFSERTGISQSTITGGDVTEVVLK